MATEGLLLLQVPPVPVVDIVALLPRHKALTPVTVGAVGSGLTVTIMVSFAVPQLLVNVYDIMALPPETPVTTPVAETVATVVLLLLHVPPVVVLPSEVVALWQTMGAPVIVPADAAGVIVTNMVSAIMPHELVNV